MKVLLIHPSFDLKEQYGELSEIIEPMLPLSLGSLGAYLEYKGVQVKVLDEQIEYLHPEVLERHLGEFLPDVVGITVLTPTANRAYRLAQDIKKIDSGILVVFGNAHPTLLPEEVLSHASVDIAVRGEGEITLWEVVKWFCEGNLKDHLKDIEGISYRGESGVVHNAGRPYEKNLDTFPPFAYHLLIPDPEKPRYHPGHLTTSRGCPWECIFCSSRSISGSAYRTLSVERVLKDLTLLTEKYSIRSFVFDDDNFIVNKARAHQICDEIIKRGFQKRLKWHCQGRGDLADEPLLRKMKQAGCVSLSFGIETASQRLLDLINKREKVEDNILAVRLCQKVGIQSRGSFILGLPTETKEESRQTIRLAKKLPLTYAKFSLATPYPGTRLYDMAVAEGLAVDGDWTRYSTTVGLGRYEPIYAPRGRTTGELKRLQRWANLSFYLTPRRLMSMFEKNAPQNITNLPKVTSFGKLWKYAKIGCALLWLALTPEKTRKPDAKA